MSRLPGSRSSMAQRFTRPFVEALAKTSMTPDALTWTGFAISVGAAALIVTGRLFAAGFVVLIGGFFDMLDGALARRTNRTTKFGGVLDSVLDRFSEAALLLGILVYFAGLGNFAGTVVTGIALFTSQMVSYLRARAEAAGLPGKEGLFTRPERVVVIVLGLLLSGFENALLTAVAVIAAFSLATAIQRLVLVWRQTRE